MGNIPEDCLVCDAKGYIYKESAPDFLASNEEIKKTAAKSTAKRVAVQKQDDKQDNKDSQYDIANL